MAYSSDGVRSFSDDPETDLNFKRPILSFCSSRRYERHGTERTDIDKESYDTWPWIHYMNVNRHYFCCTSSPNDNVEARRASSIDGEMQSAFAVAWSFSTAKPSACSYQGRAKSGRREAQRRNATSMGYGRPGSGGVVLPRAARTWLLGSQSAGREESRKNVA